jgi:hypothetical protein
MFVKKALCISLIFSFCTPLFAMEAIQDTLAAVTGNVIMNREGIIKFYQRTPGGQKACPESKVVRAAISPLSLVAFGEVLKRSGAAQWVGDKVPYFDKETVDVAGHRLLKGLRANLAISVLDMTRDQKGWQENNLQSAKNTAMNTALYMAADWGFQTKYGKMFTSTVKSGVSYIPGTTRAGNWLSKHVEWETPASEIGKTLFVFCLGFMRK